MTGHIYEAHATVNRLTELPRAVLVYAGLYAET
jgi:hypothetical protein